MHLRTCLLCLFSFCLLGAHGDPVRHDHDLPAAIKNQQEVIILEEAPPPADATEEEKASYWESVRAKYEAAMNKGAELVDKTKGATADAYEQARSATTGWYEGARDWTQEDLKKAGSWHYRVVVIDKNDIMREPAKVEEVLNQLGAERYDCYWVEPLDDSHARIAFFFKKSGFSYLKSLPSKELWRFIPAGGDADDEQAP